jgi:hypothetical protein
VLMVSGDFDHVRLGELRLVNQHGTAALDTRSG